MSKLLTELTTEVNYIQEDSNDGKHLYIEGIYLQAGIKNRNGRIYPPPLLEREVKRYIKENVERKCSYGELGHPNNPGLNSHLVSHLVTELRQDGNNWVGKARVLNEGNGKIVRGMIEAGGAVGVSSRGLGSLREDKRLGANIVQDDFRLMVAADIVLNPSAPDAWMTAVMEGIDWSFDPATNAWVKEQAEPFKNEMDKQSIRQIQENKMKYFKQFINLMKKPS